MPPTEQFETIGNYQVKAELGTGGRTRIFYAVDATTGAEVAIKLLPPDYFSDPDFKTQFELEILALMDLDAHPIVQIYQIGEIEGRPYLVQRYMSGGTLADRLMAGPLKLQDVVSITLRLAIALDAAHHVGVLHRNIKPSNVLFDEHNQAYLSDFCQVRRSQNFGSQVISWLDGAPTSMSPEQALGREDVDYRSDIYSLGALVYEMLAGQPPFTGTNPVSQAWQQVYSTPQDLRVLRTNLPEGCAAAVEWAMSKEPLYRYQSAGEFALVFEQQAVRPSLYRQQSRGKRLRIVGRRFLVGLTLLLLLAVGAGFTLSWYDYLPKPLNIHTYLTPIVITATPRPTVPTPTRTVTPLPTATRLPETPTETSTSVPTSTRTPTIAVSTLEPSHFVGNPDLTLGFADKIAVIVLKNIYIADLNGQNLVKLTTDGIAKEDLQWTPNGQALTYRQGGCYYMLSLDGNQEQLGCFEDLEFSPDMQRLVFGKKVTLEGNRNKQWLNFIFPYDTELVSMVDQVPQEPIYGGCPFVGGMQLKFSPYDDTMAGIFNPDMGRSEYEVSVYQRRSCGEPLDFKADFPTYRFTIRGPMGSGSMPTISDFGWDGLSLFAVHGDYLHGYGEMVIYNRENGRASTLYPVQGQCCYQDIQWSPDGSYLLFVFQNANKGAGAEVYYIPYSFIQNLIDTRDFSNRNGGELKPIPFPTDFFSSNIEERVEPALRQAVP